ncbi:MAG: HAMP domain-containing protein [Chromatiaceae bacterium]|nr:HAMP domain-containing protein [Chromatiaceae bacterium]MCP5421780.1 HAMP domain-containing protein [Chromatiaceae bacterium]
MNAKSQSIRRRLLTMLISTILVAWLIVLLLVYRAAEHEVEEVFDADLARSALVLQTLLLHEVQEEKVIRAKAREITVELGEDGLARFPRLASALQDYTHDGVRETLELVGSVQRAGMHHGDTLVFVARLDDGSVILRDQRAPQIPVTPAGYSDVRVDGGDWRIYGVRDAASGLTVQVGERHAFRSELVRYITHNTLMPLLLALPVLAVLVWIIVGRALSPLRRVVREVSRRAPGTLQPIVDDDTPYEIHSLVDALNSLFARVGAAIERERQFTADAAHELRTPLAALKAHLQVAKRQAAESTTQQSLDRALAGVDRATHSVEQLLLLARADAQQTRAMVSCEIDLRDVAAGVVAAMSQFAFERDIDLGVDGDRGIVVCGDKTALEVLLRNLVDNALRYTPKGGTVSVEVARDDRTAQLHVRDSGKGIPPEERSSVFNRFRRGVGEQADGMSGSGLGLSIVQRIARLHSAEITLGDGLQGRGLGVTVSLPLR